MEFTGIFLEVKFFLILHLAILFSLFFLECYINTTEVYFSSVLTILRLFWWLEQNLAHAQAFDHGVNPVCLIFKMSSEVNITW